MKKPFDSDILAQGKELHEMTCAMCHSRPQWGFAGYGVAKIISPIASVLDKINFHSFLWYLHFLSCLIGLVYLPFSKMFHIFVSPLSLIVNAVMDKEKSDPANLATKQIMELDACTHCGTCTLNCSVAVAFEKVPNFNILPSEKINSIKAFVTNKNLTTQQLVEIQEGICLCTNCYRCTVVCPVGIDLQDLWFNVKEALLKKGHPEFLLLSPLSFYRGLMKKEVAIEDYQEPLDRTKTLFAESKLIKTTEKPLPLVPIDKNFHTELSQSSQASTFSVCFGCKTCSAVCPVVANYDNPQEALGLLPHQIMYACGLGLRDLAFSSNMLWDCLTCYQCQEECPQGVCITDILYELKNLAIKQVKEKTLTTNR